MADANAYSGKAVVLRDQATLSNLGRGLDFLRMIWEVDHALQTRSKQMEVQLGVTGQQRLIIKLIGRFPTVSASQLAKTLHLDPSTIAGIIKRLENYNFIRRYQDPSDRRRFLLCLTSKGQKINLVNEGTVEAAVAAVISSLPNETMEIIRKFLSKLANELSCTLLIK